MPSLAEITRTDLAVPGGALAVRLRAGTGRPVLCVHGLSSNARLWDQVGALLAAAGHPVAAVDLRGHGASAGVPDPAGSDPTRQAAADVAAVAAALGWTGERAPVLAGQSWGGNVVLQAAAEGTAGPAGLVLVDGGWLHLGDRFADLDAAWAVLAPPAFDGLTANVLTERLAATHPDWPAEGVAATLASLHVRPDGTVIPWLARDRHRAIVGSLVAHRPRELYPQVTARTVVVAATAADGGPAATRALLDEALAGLADAELVEVRGGDHDLHAQHPDLVARAILEAG